MSANIYWEPKRNGRSVGTATPSRFMEALAEIAGALPCTLNADHVSALRALVKASDDKGFLQLAEAVERYDTIRVWAVY